MVLHIVNSNNDIKAETIHNRANQGGTQMFNQQMNLSIAKEDTNCMDNRPEVIPTQSLTTSVNSFYNFNNYYQFLF